MNLNIQNLPIIFERIKDLNNFSPLLIISIAPKKVDLPTKY